MEVCGLGERIVSRLEVEGMELEECRGFRGLREWLVGGWLVGGFAMGLEEAVGMVVVGGFINGSEGDYWGLCLFV